METLFSPDDKPEAVSQWCQKQPGIARFAIKLKSHGAVREEL
jgi:hypothetical protein